MASLVPAHRGYSYQDLLIACKLVDVLLGRVAEVSVDAKELPADRFDDLTAVDAAGFRERAQIKHIEGSEAALSASSFTRDGRRLRLDRVISSVLADRDGPGATASGHRYRIVLRDNESTDPGLVGVLVPMSNDPGPFVHGMHTLRLAFDARALWSQMEESGTRTGNSEPRFAFLGNESPQLSLADLEWVCERLVVEVRAPASSGDLTAPAEAEELLLRRVREEVGAGAFPNAGRSPVDVAAAMIESARAAREDRLDEIAAEAILRRAQLRSDFGAVLRSHPVDRSLEVARNRAVERLARRAADAAEAGGALVVTGPPGHGKSWLCQQVLEVLGDSGWLVAEHYCYLGVADRERNARVLADTVLGSLVKRIEQADARLVDGLRPRLAGDEDALIAGIARSVELEPDRKVAVVVDGIDHVTRVLRQVDGSDPSLRLAKRLASLDLPSGSVLIVLSQPGAHLAPLEESGAQAVTVDGLDRSETQILAGRLRLVPPLVDADDAVGPLVEDHGEVAEVVDALVTRSGGNALYTTYLCREALRNDRTVAAPAAAVLGFPPFDETLRGYYEHLRDPLDDAGAQVADVIGLLDFAVSRDELCSILPIAAHRVDSALDALAPVLVERAAQGIRVYHESFARHLCGAFRHNDAARCALIGCVTDWLESLGFFDDARTFRNLIPLLGDSGRDRDALRLIGSDFVARSVAAGFTTAEIVANLASAVRCAARAGDWPAVARCVELSRAAVNYREENLDPLLARYSDVLISVLGPDVVAARLVHDERPVMQISAGLRICAAVDRAGAVAPWLHYLTGYWTGGGDHAPSGEEPSLAADVAWLRGWLRLAGPADDRNRPAEHDAVATGRGAGHLDHLALDPDQAGEPVDWYRVARFVRERRLPAANVAESVLDTHGSNGLLWLIDLLDRPAEMCLAIAELAAARDDAGDLGDAQSWAIEAVRGGIPQGDLHVVLSLGVDVCDVDGFSAEGSLERLRQLTREVQPDTFALENEPIDAWLDECAAAARRNPLDLNAAEALIAGEGWYKCWLRFTIGLARAEAAASDRSSLAMEALSLLESDLRPFVGRPRSCDLFSIHHTIQDTIRRAISMTGERWTDAIRALSRVSNALTVTLYGSLGGPVPPAFVLGLAVDGVTSDCSDRRELAAELLEAENTQHSATRHYPDLAENRLLEARLAVTANELDEANRLWVEACMLMTGYGWRKDITVFELLDPLEMLIEADRIQGRARLASVQGLCERIARHTDGKETHHAPQQWCLLLAQADPTALAILTAQNLFRDCNLPNSVQHEALTDMWRLWRAEADPLIAGALRLTLDTPLGPGDDEALRRVSETETIDGAADALMVWLLARADERPETYSYREVTDIDVRDHELLAGMNAVADANGLPTVTRIDGNLVGSVDQNHQLNEPLPDHGPRRADLPEFPEGEVGLAKSVRVWRARPYRPDGPCWDIADFAEEITKRLVELVDSVRFDDAIYYLRLLADASWTRESASLLQQIADGLEQRSGPRLAATAHALAWTRARGDHGYRGFGGDEGVSSLRRATELDPELTLDIVAAETEGVVAAGNYGTYGFSKTLIHAFGVGALTVAGKSSLDIAYAAWDEVRSVTEHRAPRVHDFDDPTYPYTFDGNAPCDTSHDELNGAFALGVFAGLAAAPREKKRRALLAVQLLLRERPAQAATAASAALGQLSDPATLTWLLRVIESSSVSAASVVSTCQETLVELALREHLVVRTLARRLLQGDAPPLPPPAADERGLLALGGTGIWLPENHDEVIRDEHSIRAEAMVGISAGARLRAAEELLPGMHEAVISRVAESVANEDFSYGLRRQLNGFHSTRDQRLPDAYLYDGQTVEDALQRCASAGRSAMVRMGQAGNPSAWEDRLATLLLDDPDVLLALESRRIPRPDIPAPQQRETHNSTGETTETALSVEPVDNEWAEAVTEVRGWLLIATAEVREFPRSVASDRDDVAVVRHRLLEMWQPRPRSRTDPLNAAGNIRRWIEDLNDPSDALPPVGITPLFSLDLDCNHIGDGRHGLGVPDHVMTPTETLLLRLGLRVVQPFELCNSYGKGMALVTWRTDYDEGTYSLSRPRLVGSGVIAHPDLVQELVTEGDGQLCFRDTLYEMHLRSSADFHGSTKAI